jgi:hypothetical protein
MKPVKSLVPLAKWLLRIAAIGIVYKSGDFATALTLSFKGISYFFSLAFVVFVVLLFIGGFLKNSNLTVLSGLLLLGLSLLVLFVQIGFSIPGLLSILPIATIGFYFMARGNLG